MMLGSVHFIEISYAIANFTHCSCNSMKFEEYIAYGLDEKNIGQSIIRREVPGGIYGNDECLMKYTLAQNGVILREKIDPAVHQQAIEAKEEELSKLKEEMDIISANAPESFGDSAETTTSEDASPANSDPTV